MRRICFFTATRAEWGLLAWTARGVQNDSELTLQLLVSGMHLSPEFGMTYEAIEREGFSIDRRVEILLSSDSSVGVSKAMGLAMISFAEAFQDLKPDLLVLLGDRFEVLAAAASATVCRIPIAHFHGGEATYGAFDESFRHAVTKMAHLHFTATETYRQRVTQLGEHPSRVFCVGAPGIENVYRLSLMKEEPFWERVGLPARRHTLLVTYHPVTLEHGCDHQAFSGLLEVLASLDDTNILFTKANADMKGRMINEMIDRYVSDHSHSSVAYTSMGRLFYLSALQFVDGVVGNSSSGLLEAPSFRVATVDIGDRQKGRVRADSVVHCEPSVTGVRAALETVLSPAFRRQLSQVKNPYDGGLVSEKVVPILREFPLEGILKKEFHDIGRSEAGAL